MPSDHVDRNRDVWNRLSDAYQERHGQSLDAPGPRWGGWAIPEHELDVLGDVAGKDVLELGCGAAQWSIQLARRGARVVGLDVSERQLEHARRLIAESGVHVDLVHAAAESTPLPDASFDVVFCDHGALTWGDPYRVVPEAARVLRPHGLLAFNMSSPLVHLCSDVDHPVSDRLVRDYFGLHALEEPSGAIEFQLPYGEWIRLLGRAGLVVEDLVELRPPADARTTWTDEEWAPLWWARRWPSENIWKARKPG